MHIAGRHKKASQAQYVVRPVLADMEALTDAELALLIGVGGDDTDFARAEEELQAKVMGRNNLQVLVNRLGQEASVKYVLALREMQDYLSIRYRDMNQREKGGAGSRRLPVIPNA
jgi:hypothetical protein